MVTRRNGRSKDSCRYIILDSRCNRIPFNSNSLNSTLTYKNKESIGKSDHQVNALCPPDGRLLVSYFVSKGLCSLHANLYSRPAVVLCFSAPRHLCNRTQACAREVTVRYLTNTRTRCECIQTVCVCVACPRTIQSTIRLVYVRGRRPWSAIHSPVTVYVSRLLSSAFGLYCPCATFCNVSNQLSGSVSIKCICSSVISISGKLF